MLHYNLFASFMYFQNLDSGHSPQADKIPFSMTYTHTDPSLTIFTTANWILPITKEVIKKQSTRDIISGIGDKLFAAIGPNSAVNVGGSNSNTSSLKRDKKAKGKNKEPTAQFYDNVTRDTTDSGIKEMDSKKDISNIMPSDSEEFKRTIENYERIVEHRSTSTAQTQTNPQSGILKHKRKDPFKPLTGGRKLGFRDIVVIDNNDIDESTRNESDVIVVDKDVELIELLGGNWPNTAGEAAEILNKPKLQNSTQTLQSTPAGITTAASASGSSSGGGTSGSTNTGTLTKHNNRNKSSNPLSHVGSGAGNTKSNKNVEKKFQSK